MLCSRYSSTWWVVGPLFIFKGSAVPLLTTFTPFSFAPLPDLGQTSKTAAVILSIISVKTLPALSFGKVPRQVGHHNIACMYLYPVTCVLTTYLMLSHRCWSANYTKALRALGDVAKAVLLIPNLWTESNRNTFWLTHRVVVRKRDKSLIYHRSTSPFQFHPIPLPVFVTCLVPECF